MNHFSKTFYFVFLFAAIDSTSASPLTVRYVQTDRNALDTTLNVSSEFSTRSWGGTNSRSGQYDYTWYVDGAVVASGTAGSNITAPEGQVRAQGIKTIGGVVYNWKIRIMRFNCNLGPERCDGKESEDYGEDVGTQLVVTKLRIYDDDPNYDEEEYLTENNPEDNADDDCSDACSTCPPGGQESSQAESGSIDYIMNFGSINAGQHSIVYEMQVDSLSVGDATDWLTYREPADTIGNLPNFLKYIGNQQLKQVITEDALVNLQYNVNHDGAGYTVNSVEVQFYKIGDKGEPDGAGCYQVVPGAVPYAIYQLLNPIEGAYANTNKVHIYEKRYFGGNTNPDSVTFYFYEYTPPVGGLHDGKWVLKSGYEGAGGNQLFDESTELVSTKSTVYNWDASTTERTDTLTVTNSAGIVEYKHSQVYPDRDGDQILSSWEKDRRSKLILDPDDKALTYTWEYTKYPATALMTDINSYKLSFISRPDGFWEKYLYSEDPDPNVFTLDAKISPFLDRQPDDPDHYNNSKYLSYDYYRYFNQTTQKYSFITSIGDHLQGIYRSRISKSRNNDITGLVYQYDYYEGFAFRAQRAHGFSVTSINYTYSNGDPSSIRSGQYKEYVYTNYSYTTIDNPGGDDDGYLQISKHVSMQDTQAREYSTVTKINKFGETVFEEVTDTTDAADLVVSSKITPPSKIDAFGRILESYYLDGTSDEYVYGCCGLETSKDRAGNVVFYDKGYELFDMGDGNGPVLRRFESSTNTIPNVGGADRLVETKTYFNVKGKILAVKEIAYDGSSIVRVRNAYDLTEKLISSTDADGRETTFATTYTTNGSGRVIERIETTTLPDGVSESIQTYYPDGRIKSIRGSAERNVDFVYTMERHDITMAKSGEFELLEGLPLVCQQAVFSYDGSNNPLEWVKTCRDARGRVVKEIRSSEGGSPAVTEYWYDGIKDKILKIVDADNVESEFEYNDNDRLLSAREGVPFVGYRYDIANRTIDGQPTDVLRRRDYDVANYHLNSINESGSVENTPDGNWVSIKNYGQETTIERDVDRANARITTTTTLPGNTQNVLVEEHGMRVSNTLKAADGTTISSETFKYDKFGRLAKLTDSRNGDISYAYFDSGFIESVTTPDPFPDPGDTGPGKDPLVQYFFQSGLGDPQSRLPAGMLVGGKLPYELGGGIKSITLLPDDDPAVKRAMQTEIFYPTGEAKKIYGTRVNPVEYTYDHLGRIETLKTWQEFDISTGSGISGAATTTWDYFDQSGYLQSKTDAQSKSVQFTYTPAGRIDTKTNARGQINDYGYNSRGFLASLDLGDDGSLDIKYHNFDDQGRPKRIIDASGTRNLTYENGNLIEESYAAGPLSGLVIDRGYDSLNRFNTVELLDESTGSSVSLNQANYTYNSNHGRLQAVASGGHSFNFDYVDDSYALVESVTANNGTQDIYTTTNSWDLLNRLQSKNTVHQPSSSAIYSIAYDFNAANQRTKATINSNYDRYWEYLYDDLGQVIDAVKKDNTDTIIPGYSFGYTFDLIGNRKQTEQNGEITGYIPDSLNQYDSIEVPRTVQVIGSADSNATIIVSHDESEQSAAANRHEELFHAQIDLSNEANPDAPRFEIIDIEGILSGDGFQGGDRIASADKNVFLKENPYSPHYDDDGNLTSDGRWSYTWDELNQLVAMETESAAAYSVGIERKKIEFAYDNQGRRFQKKVYSHDGTSWVLDNEIFFLYDGWNLLSELNSSFEVQQSYTWGPDLSGSLQGAGGVGGLLSVTDRINPENVAILYPVYDGNGNIVRYVESTQGNVVAEFEYGPFGELIRATSEKKDAFNFRFSTKYEDTETGLLYYGYRYYDAETGRWLSRDPIGINGGLNAYGMLDNDPVNWVDLYGLKRYKLKYDLAPSASFLTGAKSATGFSDIMTDVKSKIGEKYSEDGKDPCNCIESIKIGGHGGPGFFYGDGTMSNDNSISNFNFYNFNRLKDRGEHEIANSMHENVAFMNQIAAYMCKGGTIEIIACEVCAGDDGDEFTGHMEDIFGEGNFKGYDQPVKWWPFGVVSEHPNKEPKTK